MKKHSRREFIKKTTRFSMGGALLASGLPHISSCNAAYLDLIIKNGLVYDGSGASPRKSDLGVKGKKITAVGDLSSAIAKQTIDAEGLAVSPGFIDVHTHTDMSLLVDPKAESKIRQGVTTEIGGNCGDSVFPLVGKHGETRREELFQQYQVEVDWSDLDGFYRRLRQGGIAFNYATLVGHGQIRHCVVGDENRPPSREESKQMEKLLCLALEQGALGLSTGLEYTPGSFATTEEIVALCKVVSRYKGVYATHMRNEDVRVEEALQEALQIAAQSGVSLQISHLKACQKRNWYKTPLLLQAIQRAHSSGINVHADRYPYTAYSTSLKMLFPLWARQGEDEKFIQRIQDQALWREILPYVEEKIAALGSWASVMITSVQSEERRHLQGKTIAQLAAAAQQNPFEYVRHLLIAEQGQVGMCGLAMSEEDTEQVLAFPLTMVGSDGDAISPTGILGKTTPHPRYYGTFPRYLGLYVREKKILPLSEAIRRITWLPAQKFGLQKRGYLARDYYADVVVFNPQTILDRATYLQPHQFPLGVEYVVVNGKIAVIRGKQTDVLAGEIITRG